MQIFPGKSSNFGLANIFAQLLNMLFEKVRKIFAEKLLTLFFLCPVYLLFLFLLSGVVVHRRHEGNAEPLKRRRENEDRGTMIINDDDLTRIAHQLYRSQNKYHSRWKAKVVIYWLPD